MVTKSNPAGGGVRGREETPGKGHPEEGATEYGDRARHKDKKEKR